MFTPVFLRSAAEAQQFLPDEGREVAVAGRSNSGKSTAINAIVGARKLARVSKTPGRTQLVNFFEVAAGKRLVDLPGYGFARVPAQMQRQWKQLVEAYFERKSLAGLLVTIDIRRGILPLDEELIGFAGALRLPALLLLTKADKLSRTQAAAQLRLAERFASERVAVSGFSAPTKQGVAQARAQLAAWLDIGPDPQPRGP